MAKERTINNLKLGTFVLAGFAFLVLLLFMLGKNQNIFGNTYVLRASFDNAQGLLAGNNVRYAGIQIGTVKRIQIINDTLIEVTMNIENRMSDIIRKNAIVSIGTEGLVGNKVVNIVPGKEAASLAWEGDILLSRKAPDADEMMQTLSKASDDISAIVAGLRVTVERINQPNSLWAMMEDDNLPADVRTSTANVRKAIAKSLDMVSDLSDLIAEIKDGRGSAGALLTDTIYIHNLNEAILKIRSVGAMADSIASSINNVVTGIQYDIEKGDGPFNALLRDSAMANKLDVTLENIMKGADGFNQNMEALKHNFLFRGYFKKLEKQKGKENQ